MNLSAPFPVIINGRSIELKPLTIRDRMAVSNLLSANASARSIALAKSLGLTSKDSADFVSLRIEEAEKMSSLIMSCFTIEGSSAILARACASVEDIEEIGSSIDPSALGNIAARCLGYEFSGESTSGK